MIINSREKTPIDTLIESSKRVIDITISRSAVKSTKYSIVIEGIDNPFSLQNTSRTAAYDLIKYIYKKYRYEKIIVNNKYSKTAIESHALYKIVSLEKLHEKRDKLVDMQKRSERKFGRVPVQLVKGFKRPNPKSMRPYEKTW